MSLRKDYLHLHFIVMIWGVTAILGMLITMPPLEVVFYRTLIASLGLLVVVQARQTGFKIGDTKNYLIVLGTGAMIAAHWVTFFLSARISTVSVCLAGMATCSLWTAIIEPLSLGRRVKGFEVILGLIALIGIVVIFNVEMDYLSGLLVAILSAFLASLFSVINGKLSKIHDPYVITFYEMVGACFSTVLFFPIYRHYYADELQLMGPLSDFIYLILLALICTVYAYSAWVGLMKRLTVFSINLTINLEPVYGILLALVIFGDREEMSVGFYLGTSLILVSVLLYPILNRKLRHKAFFSDII
ncbi:MAG: DMT family transporter [Bacteroidota bacterium]